MYNPFNKPVAHIAIEKYKLGDTNKKNEIINKSKHNFRLDNSQPMNPEKTAENVILIDAKKYPHITYEGEVIHTNDGEVASDYNFLKDVEDRIASYNISPRKDAVAAVGIVMEVTGGFGNLPKNFDLDKWTKDSMDWLEQTWGKENILSATLHVDEYTPHIHAILTPITEDGRLCCKDWLPSPESFSNMQKEYYQAVKQEGIEQCKSGMKQPFSGRESQRKAQNALYRAGEVEIVPERIPGESDMQYQKRVTNEVQQFSMQKQLQLEQEFKKMQEENLSLLREKEEVEAEKEKEKKDKEFYKEQYQKVQKEKNFYMEQLSGNGITRSELKNAAELKNRLEKEFETEKSLIKNSNINQSETIKKLEEENERLKTVATSLKEENNLYKTIVDKDGVSDKVFKNNKNMEYVLLGIKNNCQGAEDIKEGLMVALRKGKEVAASKARGELSR